MISNGMAIPAVAKFFVVPEVHNRSTFSAGVRERSAMIPRTVPTTAETSAVMAKTKPSRTATATLGKAPEKNHSKDVHKHTKAHFEAIRAIFRPGVS